MTVPENTPDNLKKEMGDLDTDTPEEKPVSTAKKKAKKTPTKASKKEVNENLISLKDLVKTYKLTAAVARRKLRAAGLKPDGRWTWEKGTPALKKAEAALAAKEDDAE